MPSLLRLVPLAQRPAFRQPADHHSPRRPPPQYNVDVHNRGLWPVDAPDAFGSTAGSEAASLNRSGRTVEEGYTIGPVDKSFPKPPRAPRTAPEYNMMTRDLPGGYPGWVKPGPDRRTWTRTNYIADIHGTSNQHTKPFSMRHTNPVDPDYSAPHYGPPLPHTPPARPACSSPGRRLSPLLFIATETVSMGSFGTRRCKPCRAEEPGRARIAASDPAPAWLCCQLPGRQRRRPQAVAPRWSGAGWLDPGG